jgi:hypothetical protein
MNTPQSIDVSAEWSNLSAILERLCYYYTKCRDALIVQKQAVIQNNVQELMRIQTELESVGESIARMEARRAQVMDKLARSASREIVNLADLIAEFPTCDPKALLPHRETLRRLQVEIRRLTGTNAEILELSRSIVQNSMRTILTQDLDPRDKAWRTYGITGTYARTVRRAPVHMVNKFI